MALQNFFLKALRHGVWVCCSIPLAHADGSALMPRNVPSAYHQECAACHLAYPPGMLPAASWKRILTGLDHHYGTNASVDSATVVELSHWLQSNARSYKRVTEEPPQDCITQSTWFVRKHQQIDTPVWRLPSVRTAANCAACHSRADKGVFDDDHLLYPNGLSQSQRRAWQD